MKMVQSWYELESDPGLFTLLVEDFGIEGVQVEEIYDLDNVSDMGSEPLGFIFLFRWIDDRRRRRKLLNENHLSVRDQSILQDMFFAHQVIPNSCATHALLSILLNSEDNNVELTKELLKLKTSTRGLTPEQKGTAIGSIPKIAEAHNSHASPHLRLQQENKSSVPGASQTGEAYHYVSYLPLNGHLYEMDGLKPWPLDHGKYDGDWTQKFSDVITERLGGGDIMFNLMAVVPDRRAKYRSALNDANVNWHILSKELDMIMKAWHDSIPDPMMAKLPTNEALTYKEWIELIKSEHSYSLEQADDPQSPEKSPVKKTLVDEHESISTQVDEMIDKLNKIDDSIATEVVLSQDDTDSRQILRELSDLDPAKQVYISIAKDDDDASNKFSLQDLTEVLSEVKSFAVETEQQLKEQEDLRDKYKIDVCRRTHNYYPFITTFLRMLAEQRSLNDMVNQLTQPKKKNTTIPIVTPTPVAKSKKRVMPDIKTKAKYKKKRKC